MAKRLSEGRERGYRRCRALPPGQLASARVCSPAGRFHRQAEALCAALAANIVPLSAADFVTRALLMLQALGWITAHRFLFSQLRMHLLGWSAFLAPDLLVALTGQSSRMSPLIFYVP
jgi:hypothetical protein